MSHMPKPTMLNKSTGPRAQGKFHPLGREMTENSVINSTHDSKTMPREKIDVSNLKPAPHYDELTNHRRNATKSKKLKRTNEFQLSKTSLQVRHTKDDTEMPIAIENMLSETTFNKDAPETKISFEPERCSPLSQTLNDNSNEAKSTPSLQLSASVNKNTRSFGNRSRFNNFKKNHKAYVHEQNTYNGFQKRTHNFRHRNASLIPKSYGPACHPTPFFSFPVQHMAYSTETFHNQNLPDCHWMEHQNPNVKKFNARSRQFPGCLPDYRSSQWGQAQHQVSNHGGMNKRSRDSILGDMSQGIWHHSKSMTQKICSGYSKAQNPGRTRDACNNQITNSTKRKVTDHKQEETLEINQMCDHKLQQSESTYAIDPVRSSDTFGQSFNEKNSHPFKKKCTHMQLAPYDHLHCDDSNARLQNDCSKLISQPNMQKIKLTGHSHQNNHSNTSVDCESHLSRTCPGTEHFMKGHTYNAHTNNSQISKVGNSYIANDIELYNIANDIEFEYNIANDKELEYNIANDKELEHNIANDIELEYKNHDIYDAVNNNLVAKPHINNDYAHTRLTDKTIERQEFCAPHQLLQLMSDLKTLPSSHHSSVHPSQIVQNEKTKDFCIVPCFKETAEVKQSSKCTNALFTAFVSKSDNSANHLNERPQSPNDETAQTEFTIILDNSLSNFSEEIHLQCMNCPDHNVQVNDFVVNVRESNGSEVQTKDLTVCPKPGSDFEELNPETASLRLAIKDEIEEEMARAQSMLIPVKVDSKRTQLIDFSLNPRADEFCPKLIDCYGNSFVMVKQKGICYFLPDVPYSRLTCTPGSDRKVDIHSPSDGTSGSVLNISAHTETYNLNTHTPITDSTNLQTFQQQMESSQYSTNLQTFEQQMESSQYSSQGHSHTDLNVALMDAYHVNSQDVYLTDSVVNSPIASAVIPECSFKNDSNQFDPLTNHSMYNSIYFTQPCTDYSNMLHLDPHTSALLTAQWKEQMNQAEATLSPGVFYSLTPIFTSSPVVPFDGSGHTQVLQAQPVPCMLQVPISAHTLPTQCTPQLHSVMQPTNQNFSRTPVFNLQTFYEATQNSPVLDANKSDGVNSCSVGINPSHIINMQNDPRSCVGNFVDAQFNFNEEMRNELSSERCFKTSENIDHYVYGLLDSFASPPSSQVAGHDDDARGRHTFGAALSNDFPTYVPQACPIPGEISANEYNECAILMHKLCDGSRSLENFQRNILFEPPVVRNQIHSLFDMALRIKNANQNNLTVAEMAASVVLLSSVMSGLTTSTNLLQSTEN